MFWKGRRGDSCLSALSKYQWPFGISFPPEPYSIMDQNKDVWGKMFQHFRNSFYKHNLHYSSDPIICLSIGECSERQYFELDLCLGWSEESCYSINFGPKTINLFYFKWMRRSHWTGNIHILRRLLCPLWKLLPNITWVQLPLGTLMFATFFLELTTRAQVFNG